MDLSVQILKNMVYNETGFDRKITGSIFIISSGQ